MGLANLKRKWLVALGTGVFVLSWTYLAFFQFDLRCFGGFVLLDSFTGVVECPSADPSFFKEDLVEIYRSRGNTDYEHEPRYPGGSIITTSGPTILRYKSGRVRFTRGAHVIRESGKVTVYLD